MDDIPSLNFKLLQDTAFWEGKRQLKLAITRPGYDPTHLTPLWAVFSPGNLASAFLAELQQELIEKGVSKGAMLGIKTYDPRTITKARKHDNLITQVVMYPDKDHLDVRIIATFTEMLFGGPYFGGDDWNKVLKFAESPHLQLATINCPEAAYGVAYCGEGVEVISPLLKDDISLGRADSNPAKWTAFAYRRYQTTKAPFAFLSCTNFSSNGNFTRATVEEVARAWQKRGFVEQGFLDYLKSEVAFPNCMIDRITPEAGPNIVKYQRMFGFDARFVNTEPRWYWVIEDKFPQGRPRLEEAGVIFVDSYEKIKEYEDMKLRLLNMAHSTIASLGILLGYDRVYKAIKDEDIYSLIKKIGEEEVLRVLERPAKIDPAEFFKETIDKRLPNPNIPDEPKRIALGFSTKIKPRFVDSILDNHQQGYQVNYLLLPMAGWLRYLLGVDDQGKEIELAPDPMLDDLKKYMQGIQLGSPESLKDKLRPILSNKNIMGVNLYEIGVGDKIEEFFKKMIVGVGAVRKTLRELKS